MAHHLLLEKIVYETYKSGPADFFRNVIFLYRLGKQEHRVFLGLVTYLVISFEALKKRPSLQNNYSFNRDTISLSLVTIFLTNFSASQFGVSAFFSLVLNRSLAPSIVNPC
jgi:hypothetical protein